MTLNHLRQRLSAVDTELIELIARRQQIVAEVSAHKIHTGSPTRDFEREREVLQGAREHAAAVQLDPDLAEEVMRLLIRSSLTRQEQSRVAAESSGAGQRALVIGGAGKMGTWMADFLASQGYGIEVADPRESSASYPRIEDWRDSALDHDLIVVAAPIKVTAEILSALAARRPRGLILDLGSLKTPLKQAFAELTQAGCRVTSIHPMFGPDTQLLSGRHVIFVDVGDAEAVAQARRLFASTMAEVVDMDLQEHDKLIGYVLGLSHALNLAFFTALAGSGELVPKLKRLSSTTFDAQLAVASRVARDNPHLYFEIQTLNDHGRAPIEALLSAARHIRELIDTNDEQGFVSLMETGRAYLAADPER